MEILFNHRREIEMNVPENVKNMGELLKYMASELLGNDPEKTLLFLSSDGTSM